MNHLFVTCIMISLAAGLHPCQSQATWTPYLRQASMYYTSGHVTAYGIGAGLGIHVEAQEKFFTQTDINIHWGNGSAITNRIAFGIHKPGLWQPAIMLSGSVLWGQRTELLDARGMRPDWPGWSVGLQLAPLRFETGTGLISALELGFGVGPDKASLFEVSLLSAGIRL